MQKKKIFRLCIQSHFFGVFNFPYVLLKHFYRTSTSVTLTKLSFQCSLLKHFLNVKIIEKELEQIKFEYQIKTQHLLDQVWSNLRTSYTSEICPPLFYLGLFYSHSHILFVHYQSFYHLFRTTLQQVYLLCK